MALDIKIIYFKYPFSANNSAESANLALVFCFKKFINRRAFFHRIFEVLNLMTLSFVIIFRKNRFRSITTISISLSATGSICL